MEKVTDIGVEKIEEHDYGAFAWLTDPEGNRIELWEPKPPAKVGQRVSPASPGNVPSPGSLLK